MTIKEALKNVISALGGTPTGKNIPGLLKDIITANGGTPTGKNIPSLINEISENVSGGGGDSGVKVTVDDGVATGYKFTVTIPDGVTEIGDDAFYNSKLASVTIPDSVTSIGDDVFADCKALTSVTIPDGVTEIGDRVFSNCKALTSVTMMATTPPSIGEDVFYSTSYNLVIYVPAESVDTYKAASGWSTYADKIQAIPLVCADAKNISSHYNSENKNHIFDAIPALSGVTFSDVTLQNLKVYFVNEAEGLQFEVTAIANSEGDWASGEGYQELNYTVEYPDANPFTFNIFVYDPNNDLPDGNWNVKITI